MTDAASTPRSRLVAWVGLILVCLFDIWWRGHTIGPTIRDWLGFAPYPVVVGRAEPLDCDEAAYAYIGEGITQGSVMYRDLSENKPPLGYWLYALTVAMGGANETAIRVMPMVPVLATIGLVWWIARRLRGSWSAFLASLLFAILGTDPYLFGNGANMEHFLNLFGMVGLAALVRGWGEPNRKARRWWIVAAGVGVALGVLVKQVAAVNGLVFALALLFADPPAGEVRWRAILNDGIALALGFVVPCLLAAAVLVAQGAGRDAWEDVVGYGSALATIKVPDAGAPPRWVRWITGNADPSGRLPPPFGRTNYLVWWGIGSWPIWLAAMPSTAWLLFRPGRSPTQALDRIVAAWTVGAWVEVALPGLFWQHYYLLPTPGLALVVAIASVDAARSVASSIRSRRLGRFLVSGLVAVASFAAIGWTARLQIRDYLLVPPEEITSRYKGGAQWVALRDLGRELGRRSTVWPGGPPSLYIWGWQSPLHFYSGLDSPTRHFFADPLLEDYARGFHRDDPRVRPRVDRIARDLEAHPPGLILVARPPFDELRRLLLDRGYRRSQVAGLNVNSPDAIGLWVDRDHFAAFERMPGQ